MPTRRVCEGAAAAAQADAHTAASVRRSRRKRERGEQEGMKGAEGGERRRRNERVMQTALEGMQWPTRLNWEARGSGMERGGGGQ